MIRATAGLVLGAVAALPLPGVRVGGRIDRAADRLLTPAADAAIDLVEAAEGLLQRLRDRRAGRCPESPSGRHTWEDIRYNGLWLGQACADCATERP